MQYHPHGDASIGDALVVLANKRYLIEGQGNFGNIFTGDPAAAPRYIECRLTELARTELFNDEITDFVPSYDGRNKEPVALPCKLPVTLMLGTEGIAVGLAARILPHNFPELLEAQIAILKKQPFKCLPDFPTGGLMDARDYSGRQGQRESPRQASRSRTSPRSPSRRFRPRPRTDSLIASIEDAVAEGQAEGQIHQRFHVRERRDRDQMPGRRGCGEIGGRAVRLHGLRNHHRQPHRGHQGQPPGGADGVRNPARKHQPAGRHPQARTGIARAATPGRTALPHAGTHLHRGTHLQADRKKQNERGGDGGRHRRFQAVQTATRARPHGRGRGTAVAGPHPAHFAV